MNRPRSLAAKDCRAARVVDDAEVNEASRDRRALQMAGQVADRVEANARVRPALDACRVGRRGRDEHDERKTYARDERRTRAQKIKRATPAARPFQLHSSASPEGV